MGIMTGVMMLFKQSEKIICSFCKLSHRVYTKKEVSLFDAALMLFITGLLAVAIWGGPDLRSMIIFMSLAFSFQVFLRMRYRESVKCPHCAFDPILYKQDSKAAAQKTKAYLNSRKNNPEFLLRPQPNIEPIYLSKDQIEKLELAGELEPGEVSGRALPPVEESSSQPVSGQLL